MIQRILAAVMLALFGAGSAHAVLLTDLLNGQSITAGDKLFDRWAIVSYTASDPTRAFDPDNIDVTPLNDGGLDPGPGLRFTVSNNELTVTGDGLFAFVDLMFGFRVTVLDPALKIKDTSLALTDASITLGDDLYDLGIYIRENVDSTAIMATPLDTGDLGTMDVQFSDSDLAGLIVTPNASADFAPQGSIWVTKNVFVWSLESTDTADLTGFEQRFSQAEVPEPATLWMAALAMAGLGWSRRKPR